MALRTGSLVEKDPEASGWPKGIDWTAYLANIADDEIVSLSTWTITGPDEELSNDGASIVTGSRKTQIRLSGGTLGATYVVTNHIETNSGVIDDQSFKIKVEHQ